MTREPLEYIIARGRSIEEMREHAQRSSLYPRGDMALIWVNESDLVIRQMNGDAFEIDTQR